MGLGLGSAPAITCGVQLQGRTGGRVWVVKVGGERQGAALGGSRRAEEVQARGERMGASNERDAMRLAVRQMRSIAEWSER